MAEGPTNWRRAAPARAPASPARDFAERLGLRVLAEGMLAERSRIDAVCADERGDIVLLWTVAEADAEAQLTRALAARAWVTARLDDWRQLAPDLPLRGGADVGVRLVATGFSAEMRAACASLPRGWVSLDAERSTGHGAAGTMPPQTPEPEATVPMGDGDAASDTSSRAYAPLPRGPLRSHFRTGLSDEALRTAAGAPSKE